MVSSQQGFGGPNYQQLPPLAIVLSPCGVIVVSLSRPDRASYIRTMVPSRDALPLAKLWINFATRSVSGCIGVEVQVRGTSGRYVYVVYHSDVDHCVCGVTNGCPPGTGQPPAVASRGRARYFEARVRIVG